MATKEKSTKQGSKTTDRSGQSDKKQQGNPAERQSGQQSGQQTGKSGNK